MSETKATIISDKSEVLRDGLENLIAQLGTEKDKRASSHFVNNRRLSADGNQDELSAMYRTDWLSGKVVDIIPNDMTREWRNFTGEIEPEMVKDLEAEEARLDLVGSFNLAHKWARLYGTAFIVMSIDDGQTPDMPLNLAGIKEGSLRHIKVIDRHRLSHADVVPIADPLHKDFGMPEFYRFNETSTRIHHSRVLRFDGVLLPYEEFRRNNYYSDSVLDRLYEALINMNTVTHGASSMVYETNVDVIKVEGLMNYLQTADGEAILRKRFALAGMLKSFNNMLLLDNKEDFTTKTNTFSGLPDLIDRYSQLLSAGSDVPATRLLGTAASGMNATGEGDLKNYYDMIRSQQTTVYRPRLDVFDFIMGRSMGLSEAVDLSYEFAPLFQMTQKETADTQLVNAQRDQIYIDRGIVTEATVAKDLKQEGTYTNITDDHISDLEEAENTDDDFGPDTDDLEIGNEQTSEGEEGQESTAGEGTEEPGS